MRPTTVFMSAISPRRTIALASAIGNVRGSISSSSSGSAAWSGVDRPDNLKKIISSVAVAGRRQEQSETDDRLRHQADFLVALAAGRRLRLFSRIDAACRQLPQPSPDRVAVLTNQDDVARFGDRQQDDRTHVTHDVDGHFPPVRHAHAVAIDLEHLAVEHSIARQHRYLVTHLPSSWGPSCISAISSITDSRSGGSGESNSTLRPSPG